MKKQICKHFLMIVIMTVVVLHITRLVYHINHLNKRTSALTEVIHNINS